MSHTTTSVQEVSWQECNDVAEKLAQAILQREEIFCGILAIARGGLVPAAILANILDIDHVLAVAMKSYRGQVQGTIRLLAPLPPKPSYQKGKWLVVDDLVDSGRTIRLLRRQDPDVFAATLYAKPQGRNEVDCYAAESEQDVWLHFPWEKKK